MGKLFAILIAGAFCWLTIATDGFDHPPMRKLHLIYGCTPAQQAPNGECQ